MYKYCACPYVNHLQVSTKWAQCFWRWEEGMKFLFGGQRRAWNSSETKITDGCWLLCRSWELNLSPLWEHNMLLNSNLPVAPVHPLKMLWKLIMMLRECTVKQDYSHMCCPSASALWVLGLQVCVTPCFFLLHLINPTISISS